MDPVRHSNDALNTERERERKHFARQKKKREGLLSLSLVDVVDVHSSQSPSLSTNHLLRIRTYRGMLQQPIDHPPTGLIVSTNVNETKSRSTFFGVFNSTHNSIGLESG